MAQKLRICLIGSTGSGKSTLGNVLLGLDINGLDNKDELVGFGVEASADICTTVTTMQAKHWLGDPGQPMVEIIDTPGHGGGGDKAEDYRQAMVDFIRRQEYIDAIVCVRNSQQPRFDAHDVEAFRVFSEVFGQKNFFQNLIIVFSRWSFSSAEDRKRAMKSGATLEKLKSDLQAQMKSSYPGMSTNIPIGALDALYEPEDKQERNIFLREAGQLWHIVSEYSNRPLMVEGVKMVEDQDKKLERNVQVLEKMESTIKKKHEQEALIQQQCLKHFEQRNAAMALRLAANHHGLDGLLGFLSNTASRMRDVFSSSPASGNYPTSGVQVATSGERFPSPAQSSGDSRHRTQPSSPIPPKATAKPPLSTNGLTPPNIGSGNGPDGNQASWMKDGLNHTNDTAMDTSSSAAGPPFTNGTDARQNPAAVDGEDITNGRNDLATLQENIKQHEEYVADLQCSLRLLEETLAAEENSLQKKKKALASLIAHP